MTPLDAKALLRPGLLRGVRVLLAGAPVRARGALTAAVNDACSGLGAEVAVCGPALDGEDEDQLAPTPAPEGLRIDVLVVDGAALFAWGGAEHPTEGARAALRGCLECAWALTRTSFHQSFLRAGAGGRILYVTPAAEAGEYAGAALAGLENLARTLSIEWSRHGITAVAIAPGANTAAVEVAALCAYLASPAGAYFSGCLLDLRGVAGERRR